jgi:hypothetical protein
MLCQDKQMARQAWGALVCSGKQPTGCKAAFNGHAAPQLPTTPRKELDL